MQQLAHGLELHAGFAPQPRTGLRRDLAPEAAQGRQAPCASADAGGGNGPGTGAQARRAHLMVLLACCRRLMSVTAPFLYTVTASSWPPSHSAQERVLRE